MARSASTGSVRRCSERAPPGWWRRAPGLALEGTVPAPVGVVRLIGYLGVGGVLTVVAYVVVLHVLGVEEIVTLPRAIRGRLRSRVAV